MIATDENLEDIRKLYYKHWDLVSDDYSRKDEIKLDSGMNLYLPNFYVLVVPLSHTMADIHIISDANDTQDKAYQVFKFLNSNTGIRSLIAHIPTYNKRCVKFVENIGFNLIGIHPRSLKKNGQLKDQFIYTRGI